ncbi:hypothetical protein [Mucilaginibacter paludis]|uniref:Uncharacterized protein n=1 Tax=Mucilaginibacter paludis DSM 18603 TaxID=714943 RepID=H1Y5L7_9SPHI|nr:hypothetical protein [Mucilaginibacter paludis]EHQ29793.1 hypothetical protein Mucpa_5725 [Mucilaginibacter paludis DSM 18603]
METIKLDPLKAEIKTLVLGGKKLTKSIFRQIEFRDCVDERMNFTGDKCFGYVKDGEHRFVLWLYNGNLRKMGLSPYMRLKELEYDSTTLDIELFVFKCKLGYYATEERGGYTIEFKEGERQKYNELVVKVKKLISEVMENQIFL